MSGKSLSFCRKTKDNNPGCPAAPSDIQVHVGDQSGPCRPYTKYNNKVRYDQQCDAIVGSKDPHEEVVAIKQIFIHDR